jgi:competence protein ComEC
VFIYLNRDAIKRYIEGIDGDSQNDTSSMESIVTDDLSIHFLELGNKYTGDCTLIKVGNTEVLIDAGSRKGSAATIVPYIQQYCTDGVLEYVIATHAHQDHIAGFVGTTTADGVFESFVCGTIIDYSLANTTSQIRKDYEALRDAEVQAGAKHYTALECWNNENGASRSYTLAEGITMNFLYQEFYETKTSDENDYSVCMLLSQGNNHYLFTGDLEGHGEKSLVESNNLPECVLFKGGHHGSPTSNTTELLSVIKPDIVCVCCCCGSDEYTDNIANMFPSQAFVDRVAPYTDRVYVTTMVTEDDGYQSMNGNIVVTSDGTEVSVNCSNNNILFKDTEWFKKNRTMPDAWK